MEKIESSYKKLLEPSNELMNDITKIDGDIIILGVGGKMGPNLAKAPIQAVVGAGKKKKIIGVFRFFEPGLEEDLNKIGIETYKLDLLDSSQLAELPEVKNV